MSIITSFTKATKKIKAAVKKNKSKSVYYTNTKDIEEIQNIEYDFTFIMDVHKSFMEFKEGTTIRGVLINGKYRFNYKTIEVFFEPRYFSELLASGNIVPSY